MQCRHIYATSHGHEVVKADARDILTLDIIENLRHALHVVAGEGEAKPCFLPYFFAKPKPADSGIKGSRDAAELIVHGADAIQ